MKENFFIWSGRRDSNSRLRHKLHFGFALQPQRLIERLFVPFPKNLAVFWESPQMSLLENKKIAFSTNAISKLERKTRFELATFALARQRSTTEPLPQILKFIKFFDLLLTRVSILYILKTSLLTTALSF